ncbi:MAG: hypothetical protein R2786_06990 [Flavobacteriaceae bacterium]
MQTVLHYLTLLLTGTFLQAQTTAAVSVSPFCPTENNPPVVFCIETENSGASFNNSDLCSQNSKKEVAFETKHLEVNSRGF